MNFNYLPLKMCYCVIPVHYKKTKRYKTIKTAVEKIVNHDIFPSFKLKHLNYRYTLEMPQNVYPQCMF